MCPKLGYTSCVGRIPTIEAVSPFGEWLESLMRDYGLNRKMLASRAGVGTTTVGNWIAGLRFPKKSTIERIAGALSKDAENARALLNAGLRAAGFLPEGERDVREQYQSDMVREHPVYNYLEGQPPPRLDKAQRILEAAFANNDAENALYQQAAVSPSPVTTREMRQRATRLTGEVRARDARVARAEAVIWTVDMEGRFLLSEGEGLKQAEIAPGQVVGLRIWDVYKGETDFLEKVHMVLASDGPLEWTTTVRGTPWRLLIEPRWN